MRYYIKTFGCQQNTADSERIASFYDARGDRAVFSEDAADTIVINTCMIREKAEERVYGYIRNLRAAKSPERQRIVLTGCIVGAAAREPSGAMRKKLLQRIPDVELLPIEDVGFEHPPKRGDDRHAWIVISNGCNNYCAFCIVPYSRGKERSRPFEEIVNEAEDLARRGYTSITLLGQNVNSYGADIVAMSKITPPKGCRKSKNENDKGSEFHMLPDGTTIAPVMVKHLGRHRIPTLFPHLLARLCAIKGLERISFISANPWDFSDELINVIARNANVERTIHLPVQSGANEILKRMNRWYTREDYLALVDCMRAKIPGVQLITDIIVGFPGETEEHFRQTVNLARRVGFVKAFLACYSPRPGTAAAQKLADDVPQEEKKRRFRILDDIINGQKKEAFDATWINR